MGEGGEIKGVIRPSNAATGKIDRNTLELDFSSESVDYPSSPAHLHLIYLHTSSIVQHAKEECNRTFDFLILMPLFLLLIKKMKLLFVLGLLGVSICHVPNVLGAVGRGGMRGMFNRDDEASDLKEKQIIDNYKARKRSQEDDDDESESVQYVYQPYYQYP